MTIMRKISRAAMVALAVLFAASLGGDTISFNLDRQARAQTAATPAAPGKSDDWRAVRQGRTGYVSIPDKQAGRLIQSGGENWRNWRNGPISVWGGWAMLGTIALLALFFAVRGRIRIEHGASGRQVQRFNDVERFAHWLTAVSFLVLAFSGLNILYGRYVLRPIIGADAFTAISALGKYLHNYVAFAFMAGIVLILVLWVRHNVPTREDLAWLAKGGGLLVKGSHPPARKFNAGQKILYWLVVLGGISLSLSGIALLWPFEFALFAPTFKVLNILGLGLPTDLTAMQEVQLSQMWHAVAGLILIAVTIGHIYLGTLGMEGAFDAMGTGMVDENWAREHHELWVAELSAGKQG